MTPPFQVHTQLVEQYEKFIGGGAADGLATLTLVNGKLTVPCTHSEVAGDLTLVAGGFSPRTMIAECDVRASVLGSYVPQKGHRCTLRVNPAQSPLALQIWSVNQQSGGEILRFTLVDASHKA